MVVSNVLGSAGRCGFGINLVAECLAVVPLCRDVDGQGCVGTNGDVKVALSV